MKKTQVEFLNGGSLSSPLDTKQLLLLLLSFSFAATGTDVLIAHFQNHLIPKFEWIPVIYSPVLVITTILYLFKNNHNAFKFIYKYSLYVAFLVGLIGTGFHLLGNITREQPLTWLYVGTPLLAPLAYSGMALFGLALVKPDKTTLLRLVALGFLVDGLTALLDHAQGEFASPYTFIPIIGGFFAFVVTWWFSSKIHKGNADISSSNLYYGVMLMMIVVGIAGFTLHVITNLEGMTVFSLLRLFYHTPPLAPLVFSQMGLLGILATLEDK